jgi:S1-C subfamily serine protease
MRSMKGVFPPPRSDIGREGGKRPFPPSTQKPAAPEAEPASDWRSRKTRLLGLYSRYRLLFLLVANLLVTISMVLLLDAVKPAPQRLTQRDIDSAVGRTLESMPPKPSAASVAFEAIRPSLVGVLAGREGGSTLGAGVVIEDNGTILTCLHVVSGAEKLRVVFADGSQSDAETVGRYPQSDLAVLRAFVVPDDLKPATLASSASLRVGDEVEAVGNPFGILDSASFGIVSGLGRAFTSRQTGVSLSGLIQFDAAVNPGNSGGPLVNRDGEVVGIVTALLNPTSREFFVGIGFAVPMDTAAGIIGGLPY